MVHSAKKSMLLSTLALALALALGMGMAMPSLAAQQGETSIRQDRANKWPQATLSAQASALVEQDSVRITLAAEFSDASQAEVSKTLTRTIESVMKQARDVSRVKATSGNFQIWPVSDKQGAIASWHGRGEIFLESSDFAAASDLAALLGDRMPIAGLAFSVTPQARARQEEALLTQAAQAFQKRAKAVTEAFGYSSYTLRKIELGGAGASYRAPARMMALSSEKASVPLEPGTETVTVSVQGSIFLHSQKK